MAVRSCHWLSPLPTNFSYILTITEIYTSVNEFLVYVRQCGLLEEHMFHELEDFFMKISNLFPAEGRKHGVNFRFGSLILYFKHCTKFRQQVAVDQSV
jgi:hypothetical protein